MKKALIIVDLQRDFCPGGALAVKDGDSIVPAVNSLAISFDKVVATRDWHPKNHISFASNHPGKKVQEILKTGDIEQVLWPDHCVPGTPGAEFHPDLDQRTFDLIISKGTSPKLDSYSGFFENDHLTPTGLDGYLKNLGINDLAVCGLATDYCVFYTVMDAIKLGYKVDLVSDCVRGVDFPQGNVQERLEEMQKAGARIVASEYPA
ncbi:bifunctional nicotinamidase/pyrazinamidase [Marispirochaeta aestuarii]|uniref:bifunctional nicotinamidase/pyrazinamidase n=1 Tax=Marispirochaeta aestuarii TaxID=1963862 RepID=UPI0029C6EDBF|nr:bifunctional nicotinamidase/pyrazinamidase [Marispirochaeta aestuarii]